MTQFVSIKPIEKVTFEIFNMQDVEIIATHYGYDFAEVRVKNCGFNNNLIGMVGYGLVENGKFISNEMSNAWRTDEEVLKKLYAHDKKYGHIRKNLTFEEFKKRIKI